MRTEMRKTRNPLKIFVEVLWILEFLLLTRLCLFRKLCLPNYEMRNQCHEMTFGRQPSHYRTSSVCQCRMRNPQKLKSAGQPFPVVADVLGFMVHNQHDAEAFSS